MDAVVLADRPACLDRLGGIAVIVRLLRTLRDAGIGPVRVLSTLGAAESAELRRLAGNEPRPQIQVVTCAGLAPRDLLEHWPERAGPVLVIGAELVLDRRAIEALAAAGSPAALVDPAPPATLAALLAAASPAHGLRAARLDPAWLAGRDGAVDTVLRHGLEERSLAALDLAALPTYSTRLRRHHRPFAFPAPGAALGRRAERVLLDATQKGSLDIPAYCHAPLEKLAARLLAPWPVTPNQVTAATGAVAFLATACLATGRLGAGLAIALAVGVLDGVDGKLARLKLETSRLGELEHHLDFAYEWSWWMALAHWLETSGRLEGAWVSLAMLAVFEALDGLLKGWVIHRTGRTIDEAGRFERAVRLVGGRRNVYVWILAAGALLGAPAAAFALLPWWQGATAALHLPRAIAVARPPARQ